VFTWSGVRALEATPSQTEPPQPKPDVLCGANGTGGFVTLYGGKLTRTGLWPMRY
jgi:hypothetical protein